MKSRIPRPDAGGSQFARVFDIGGEEHVEGRPVADLGEEIAGRTVSDVQLHRGVSGAEFGGDVLHGEIQVGGGGDAELLGSAAAHAQERAYDGQYQQSTRSTLPP